MTPRARRVALVSAGVVALLFAGRGASLFLAERWWAATVSAPGAVFTTRWTLLRLGLDAAGIVLGIGWFALNLLLAARRAGAAAPAEAPADPRFLPLRPGLLTWWAAGTAVLLGLLTGIGTAEWAPTVALASTAPRWGILDPLQGADAGFYLATLPLLLRIEELALALTLLAFIASLMVYAIGGALRVAARRFVLDRWIRLHLGMLGTAFALVLAFGYFLDPWELAAGLRAASGTAHAVLLSSLSRLMVGLALATAALTALWGVRGRTMVPAGAWAAFALFALVIRLLAPAAGAAPDGDRPAAQLRELEREAFALPDLLDATAAMRQEPPVESLALALWDPGLAAADSGGWLAGHRGRLVQQGVERPVLLLVGGSPAGAALTVVALADQRTTAAGGPLAYRGDSIPYPGLAPILELPAPAARPRPALIQVGRDSSGVPAGGILRRLALTWALQANLLRTPADNRVTWRMDPGERLRAMAPFAEWSVPRPRIVAGQLVWLSDGYLHAGSFPGVSPAPWRGRSVSYLRAAMVGVVWAREGTVRVFERGDPDPLARAWSGIARGLVEPDTAMPPALVRELDYPGELFAVQSLVLQRGHWGLGALARPPAGLAQDSLPGPVRRAAYAAPDGRRLVTLVEASHQGGTDRIRTVRLDSLTAPEPPALLAQRWERLPFVEQMRDSVQASGSRLVLGPVRMAPAAEGLLAWQAGHAVDSTGRGTLILVNLAHGGRLGTGPRPEAAWLNLRGALAALPTGLGADAQLRQAREWLLRADSAFRRGDLAGFGRAFEALRALLDYPPGVPK